MRYQGCKNNRFLDATLADIAIATGNIDNAYKIIDMAKHCGANAVKMQTYSADTITMDIKSNEFKIDGGLWDGRYLYDLYGEAYTPWSWHKPLFEYSKNITAHLVLIDVAILILSKSFLVIITASF